MPRILVAVGVPTFAAGILATAAASIGWFRPAATLLWLGFAVALLAWGAKALRRRPWIALSRPDQVAIAVAVAAALSAAFLHHEYSQAQMDTGFYEMDARIIAQTGGHVTNAPYDGLLPGFQASDGGHRVAAMPAYPSWIALFVFAFGAQALPWANAPLAFIASLAVFLIGKRLGGPAAGLLGQSAYGLSLLTLWFNRWAMTENAATAAFLFGAWALLALVGHWDVRRGALLLPPLVFAGMVRLEGSIWAAWMLLLVLAASWRTWAPRLLHTTRSRPWVPLMAGGVTAVAALLVAATIRAAPPTYVSHSLDLAQRLLTGRIAADAYDVPVSGPSPNWGDYALRFQWDSVQAYGFHWLAVIAAAGLLAGIVQRRPAAWLVAAALPYTLFVLMPPVTTFHPWFMRRLWVALLPVVLILAAAGANPRRWGRRWPVRDAGRTRPRVPLLFLGVTLSATVALVVLDSGGPVLLQREDDGAAGISRFVRDHAPRGAIVILDQDVVGYATRLRFDDGYPVISWFQDVPNAFAQSLGVPATPTFLLRFEPRGSLSVLRTDAEGSSAVWTHDGVVRALPRYSVREYLRFPPLSEGYTPLEAYLENYVPPKGTADVSFTVSLVALQEPPVLFRIAEPAPGDWRRAAEGLVAHNETGRVLVNRSLLNPDYLSGIPLRLFLAHPSGTPPPSVVGDGESASHQLPGPEASIQAERVTISIFSLPVPMNFDAFHVRTSALRGALLAP